MVFSWRGSGRAADLDPSVEAPQDRSAAVPVADAVRETRAELGEAPAPGTYFIVRAARGDADFAGSAVCESIYPAIDKRGEFKEADGGRGRPVLQHARGRSSGAGQSRGAECAGRREAG